jgi:hypothetical protein
MLSLGPDVPPGLRPLLTHLLEAVRSLKAPGAPGPVFACTVGDLPPAAAWPHGLVFLRDLSVLAVSDGSAWVRQDTGESV